MFDEVTSPLGNFPVLWCARLPVVNNPDGIDVSKPEHNFSPVSHVRMDMTRDISFGSFDENLVLVKRKLGDTFVATTVQPPPSVSMSQKAWNEPTLEPPFGSIQ